MIILHIAVPGCQKCAHPVMAGLALGTFGYRGSDDASSDVGSPFPLCFTYLKGILLASPPAYMVTLLFCVKLLLYPFVQSIELRT